ncbi:hypothetical protein FB45DRAFT_57230 [Roridomyces roridus]|uniref:Uncharacterized protein n=1 Tax=Roridomyces roridus TaxID=1738132 RepID=A0AAD7FIZ7_9AGAR|nr:hypothetical protein FB45DRAFT_57230 [Roridomyces roridus]
MQLHFLGVTNWHRPPSGTSKNIVAPAEKDKRARGRQNLAQNRNTTALYIQDGNGNVIDGDELSKITSAFRANLVDLHAAGMVTDRVDLLGRAAKAALVFQLEEDFPYLGYCVDHWKVNMLITAKYRDWSPPAKAGTKRASETEEEDGTSRKRRLPNPADDEAGLIPMTSSTPTRTTPPQPPLVVVQPTPVQPTLPPPAIAQTTAPSQDELMLPPPVPDSIQTTLQQLPQTLPAATPRKSLLASVRVSPPPAPTVLPTPSVEAAAPKTKTKGKPAAAHPAHITSRNIYLATYAADVGGTMSEFTVHFEPISKSPEVLKPYEAYVQELKKEKIKRLPDLDSIRAALKRLQGAVEPVGAVEVNV